jgi:hypothetical protein
MAMQTTITGIAVDIMPTAIPLMITVAGPVSEASATDFVGLVLLEV